MPISFPKNLHHFNKPPAMFKGSIVTSSPAKVIFFLFMFAILMDVHSHLSMVLTCIF